MKVEWTAYVSYKPLHDPSKSPFKGSAPTNQGHREFPFWKRKIPPPAKEKIPENSRSVKCLILHALTQ